MGQSVEWVRLDERGIMTVPVQSPLVIDIETISPDVSAPDLAKDAHRAQLVDVFLYSEAAPNVAYVVGSEHLEALKERLYAEYSKDFVIVGQGFKYDIIVLSRHGLNLNDFCWDDVIHYDHLDDENRVNNHGLAAILKREFKVEYKDDFWKRYRSYLDAPEEERCEYGSRDVYWTAKAYKRLRDRYTASERARQEAVTESLKHGAFRD